MVPLEGSLLPAAPGGPGRGERTPDERDDRGLRGRSPTRTCHALLPGGRPSTARSPPALTSAASAPSAREQLERGVDGHALRDPAQVEPAPRGEGDVPAERSTTIRRQPPPPLGRRRRRGAVARSPRTSGRSRSGRARGRSVGSKRPPVARAASSDASTAARRIGPTRTGVPARSLSRESSLSGPEPAERVLPLLEQRLDGVARVVARAVRGRAGGRPIPSRGTGAIRARAERRGQETCRLGDRRREAAPPRRR